MTQRSDGRRGRTLLGIGLGLFVLLGLAGGFVVWRLRAAAGSAPLGAGDRWVNLSYGGRDRRLLIHQPGPAPRDGAVRWPVVLSLHGGGGDVLGQVMTDHLNPTADAHDFVVVRPEGVAVLPLLNLFHVWNAGSCCAKGLTTEVDDVGFMAAVLDQVERELPADPKRVYATGLSNGAMMSVRLGCELSERIAAIAPVAGGLMIPECRPRRPVPMFYLHGTGDRCLPYLGPAVGGCFSDVVRALGGPEIKTTRGIAVRSVPEFLALWRGLGNLPDVEHVIYSKGSATCRQAGPDARGFEVVGCTIEGGGHTWPGGGYGGPCGKPDSRLCKAFMKVSGVLTQDLNADEAMWEFFRHHTLP